MKSSLRKIYRRLHDLVDCMEYLCHKCPQICRKHSPVISSFRTYHRFETRLTRRVSLVEQDLPTLLEQLNSSPVFSGVLINRTLFLYVCFVDRYLSFCAFSFGHCVVCSSPIYGFGLLFGIFRPFFHLIYDMTAFWYLFDFFYTGWPHKPHW